MLSLTPASDDSPSNACNVFAVALMYAIGPALDVDETKTCVELMTA